MPILLLGSDELVTAANPAARALLGDHLMGRHYITALRQPALLDQVEQVYRTGQPGTARYLGRAGDSDTSYDVKVSRAGSLTVLAFTDQSALEDVGKLRRDFVANVSHELRTPLTALLGFIETLRGAARNDPAAREKFLEIMAREAGRMTRLVDDLLSLSRVEEDERVRPVDPVPLGEVLRATLTELGPVSAAAGVTVTLSDSSGGATVPGDAGQLRQVFGNLVENAIKYGKREGEVRVTISAPAEHVRLRGAGVAVAVADEGQGIAPHHIPRLTERFYRVDDHRGREVGGTGLGLAIVKHIVNRHRGRLVIESVLGRGTTITVLLPSR